MKLRLLSTSTLWIYKVKETEVGLGFCGSSSLSVGGGEEGRNHRERKMKTILSSETMDIPDGVKVKINAKVIEVEGSRGKLSRDFKHLNLDFHLMTDEETGKRKLKIDGWFGSRKTSIANKTVLNHAGNLIISLTKGYCYKICLYLLSHQHLHR